MNYVELFENLKPSEKYASTSPQKATILLAVIDLYDHGVIDDNRIEYNDALISSFLKLWNKLTADDEGSAAKSFWALNTESFWHIVPIRGKADIIKDWKTLKVSPTDAKIRDCVNYVELDDDLYFLMTLPSGRKSLNEALLSSHFNLSDKNIERFSQVRENASMSDADFESMFNSLKGGNQDSKKISTPIDSYEQIDVDEEVWLTICIAYYTFLKRHKLSRELFKGIFSSPIIVYQFITDKIPITIPTSLIGDVEDFLHDLNIALMKDNSAIDIIDLIHNITGRLRGIVVEGSSADEVEDHSISDFLSTYGKGYYKQEEETEEDFNSIEQDVYDFGTDDDQSDEEDEPEEDDDDADFNYVPKGRIKNIEEFVDSSYDYLWTMAIVDLVYMTNRQSLHSFDAIACMMIANAWELLRNYEKARICEEPLCQCIEFLIDESKESSSENLTWESTKDEVYNTIKDFPMYGIFEEMVDELIETSPLNVLRVWFSDYTDKKEIILESKNFTRPCLYAINARKKDPYIEINKKWLNNLFYEHDGIIVTIQRIKLSNRGCALQSGGAGFSLRVARQPTRV